MASVSLNKVKQKFDAKKGAYFTDFEVTKVPGGIAVTNAGAPWSPHVYDTPDALAELMLAGLLYKTWLSHSQYLTGLFGEHLVDSGTP